MDQEILHLPSWIEYVSINDSYLGVHEIHHFSVHNPSRESGGPGVTVRTAVDPSTPTKCASISAQENRIFLPYLSMNLAALPYTTVNTDKYFYNCAIGDE